MAKRYNPEIYKLILKTVKSRIIGLDAMKKTGPGKAELAGLRRGAGKSVSESLEAAQIVLSDLPAELIGNRKSQEALEAIYTALTLFAMQQQGNDGSILTEDKNSIGTALRDYMIAEGLSGDEDRKKVVRKLGMLLKAKSIREIAVYLKSNVQLMKSASQPIYIDYARLAGDLYRFQFPEYRNSTLLDWAKDFYKNKEKKEEEKEEKK